MRSRKSTAKGMALVIVLFILVIMTTTAAWLSEDILLHLRTTENTRNSTQAWQTLLGSESWALSVLIKDSQESQSDHPGEGWNSLGKGVEIEQGRLLTVIEDMQGRLNLNNMIEESIISSPQTPNKPDARIWTGAFRRLLISLELNPLLSDAVLDWLDPDQNVRGTSGAEDVDYLSMTPPYRTANHAFSEISELLQVKGFDKKTVQKLAPFIAALPAKDVRININTAPAGLLRILGKNTLSIDESRRLVSDRPQDKGYTVEEFLQHDMMAGEQDIATPLITNQSSYFLIKSSAEIGRSRAKIVSLVERKNGKVGVIGRSPVL
ncbi:MAG: type II secretion system minor pseudopilin GspK [Pseudomonadota bacterium]|nr:type II secretion system minor pseudopilin GspK [Pseudomonadota bacterium]